MIHLLFWQLRGLEQPDWTLVLEDAEKDNTRISRTSDGNRSSPIAIHVQLIINRWMTPDFQGTWISNEISFFLSFSLLNEISRHGHLEYFHSIGSHLGLWQFLNLSASSDITKNIKTTVEIHTVIIASEVLLILSTKIVVYWHFTFQTIYTRGKGPWRCHSGKRTT